jgi:alpha-ribazole phosphatase
MTRLILARHGETPWNAWRRLQGLSDTPLSGAGRLQALALARRLAGEGVDEVYASDLRRAWETATTIAAPHHLPVRPDPRLREIAFGAWEGLTYNEIQQQDPQTLAAWQADPMDVAPPGGETLTDVVARVGAALEQIVTTHRGQIVLLVAHGGSLQVLLCLALGLAPPACCRFPLALGSLSELHLDGEAAILRRLNDTHHLAKVTDDGPNTHGAGRQFLGR